MQKILMTGLLLLCANPVFAGNLCDAQCSVFIDFPDGGSLIATEELTITFGDDGLIDTVASQTAYLADNTLTLNEGERIDFAAGGSFDIGDAGNIAYTSLELVTPGEIEIVAVGGPETVSIINVTVSGGDAVFNVDATDLVVGPVEVVNGENLFISNTTGSITINSGISATNVIIDTPGYSEPYACSTSSEPGGSITISSGDEPTIVSGSGACVTTGVLTVSDDFVAPSAGEIYLSNVEESEGLEQGEAEESGEGAISFDHLLALLVFLSVHLAIRRIKSFTRS